MFVSELVYWSWCHDIFLRKLFSCGKIIEKWHLLGWPRFVHGCWLSCYDFFSFVESSRPTKNTAKGLRGQPKVHLPFLCLCGCGMFYQSMSFLAGSADRATAFLFRGFVFKSGNSRLVHCRCLSCHNFFSFVDFFSFVESSRPTKNTAKGLRGVCVCVWGGGYYFFFKNNQSRQSLITNPL